MSKSDKLSVLFCGGGSGGHLFPAIAVCEELQNRYGDDFRPTFLTTGRAIESKILNVVAHETICLPAVMGGEFIKRPFRSTILTLSSIKKCRTLFREISPQVVVGLGGYGSIPGILAARTKQIPTLLMEQNSVPGQANQFLSRFANVVCTSFPESHAQLSRCRHLVLTGNPVRKSIKELSNTKQERNRPTVAVLGGSQGASALNQAMQAVINQIPECFGGWQILHQTGVETNHELQNHYQQAGITAEVRAFWSEILDVYRSVDLVVSRAGATTLAELAVLGIPAILVPYPHSIRDHQELNARYYEQSGAAKIVLQDPDPDLFAANLTMKIKELIARPAALAGMASAMKKLARCSATEEVADEFVRLVQRNTFD